MNNAYELLNALIGSDVDQSKLSMAYECAVAAATKYVNNPNINVVESYAFPIANLAYYYYKSLDNLNLQSLGQGSRSFTFLTEIPDNIKSTLPHYGRGIY